jgi:hypothetical protein
MHFGGIANERLATAPTLCVTIVVEAGTVSVKTVVVEVSVISATSRVTPVCTTVVLYTVSFSRSFIVDLVSYTVAVAVATVTVEGSRPEQKSLACSL